MLPCHCGGPGFDLRAIDEECMVGKVPLKLIFSEYFIFLLSVIISPVQYIYSHPHNFCCNTVFHCYIVSNSLLYSNPTINCKEKK